MADRQPPADPARALPPGADRRRVMPAFPESAPELVARALAEDLGDGDVTAEATISADARAKAEVFQKAPGVVYGIGWAMEAFLALDPGARVVAETPEGVWHVAGNPVLRVAGNARALLGAERTALNFLGRLSGIATLTARCVREVEGTGARILDTRKTTPGLRMAEKAAVYFGGGTNHRIGLFDEVLIKENHAAAAGGVGEAVRRARAARPELPVEVEVRTLDELDEALDAGAPRIMLDNMELVTMRAAVQRTAGRASLEASGGATLARLREIAETGIDFISIGALTHSAPALDLSLILEPL